MTGLKKPVRRKLRTLERRYIETGRAVCHVAQSETDIDKCLKIQEYILTSDMLVFESSDTVNNWTALDYSAAFMLMATWSS